MSGLDDAGVDAQQGPLRAGLPGPDIARPKLPEQMQRRCLRPAIDRADPHQDVVGAGLGIFDGNVEIPALIE
jgi:hypothetical protein